MLALVLTFLTIGCVMSELEFPRYPGGDLMPEYIKQALKEKNKYVPKIPEKKRTLTNLTMKEVFDHIKDITRALNYKAYQNGFKVDYRFRVLDNL